MHANPATSRPSQSTPPTPPRATSDFRAFDELPTFNGFLPLRNGHRAWLRPAQPEDALQAPGFLQALSPRTQRRRFHGRLPALGAAALASSDVLKNPRHRAWVGLLSTEDGQEHLVADARYVCDGDGREAEFAIVVGDTLQRQGLGRALLLALQSHAAQAGVRWLRGEVQVENIAMLRLLLAQDFRPALCDEAAGLMMLERRLLAPGG
jgi:acetyltransferase